MQLLVFNACAFDSSFSPHRGFGRRGLEFKLWILGFGVGVLASGILGYRD